MSRRVVLRSLLALAFAAASALPGVTASAAAEPIAPGGGCWRYEPGEAGADISTGIEPWTEVADAGGIVLETAGATAVSGERTFTLTLPAGPSVPPPLADLQGTASFFLDVVDGDGQRTSLDPVEVPFTVLAQEETIGEVVADGSFPLATAGVTSLILRRVDFDLAGIGQQLTCNGQTEGTPGGPNPLTDPIDTDVRAEISVVAAAQVTVTQVRGQLVRDALRPGDGVDVELAGLDSGAPVLVSVCSPADSADACGPDLGLTADEAGRAAGTIPGAADLAPGDAAIRVRDGAGTPLVSRPIRVLGRPTLSVEEGSQETRLDFSGGQWDPLRTVQVEAVDDAGERVGRRVLADADAAGEMSGLLVVPADTAIAGVVAVQERDSGSLEVFADYEIAVPDATDETDDETDTETDADDETDTTPVEDISSSDAVTETAPLEIPAPEDLDVDVVPGPGDSEAPRIAVLSARLVGSARFAELFGAGPRRTIRLVVTNVSEQEVLAPGLRISAGKGEDIVPVYESGGFARLKPGDETTVEIPINLPAGAMGTYTISGQFGDQDSGTFLLTWRTYPWGLFAINVLALVLVGWALWRRAASSRTPAMATAGLTRTVSADAVIDLEAMERWEALRAAGPGGAESAGAVEDAVVDLEAADRWLNKVASRTDSAA